MRNSQRSCDTWMRQPSAGGAEYYEGEGTSMSGETDSQVERTKKALLLIKKQQTRIDELEGDQNRRVRRLHGERVCHAGDPRGWDAEHRGLPGDRWRGQFSGRPPVVPTRFAGTEPAHRHGLFVVAGGGTPGMPESA